MTSHSYKELRYFTDQNGLQGDNIKMNFGYFHIQKIMSQTIRTEKAHEKNRSLFQFACDFPEL